MLVCLCVCASVCGEGWGGEGGACVRVRELLDHEKRGAAAAAPSRGARVRGGYPTPAATLGGRGWKAAGGTFLPPPSLQLLRPPRRPAAAADVAALLQRRPPLLCRRRQRRSTRRQPARVAVKRARQCACVWCACGVCVCARARVRCVCVRVCGVCARCVRPP